MKSRFNRKPYSKYKNIKTEVDGLIFDSKKEASYYLVLKERAELGQISDLKTQVTYRLESDNKLICKYIADFVYEENGQTIVVDVKSVQTQKCSTYRLKKKMMKIIKGIEITEVI